MAYPPAYDRTFSFTDWEVAHPGEPKPGSDLDAEFDSVSNALTATQANLALIQRSDGALANDSVGEDQLQDGLLDGIVDGVTADAEAAAAAAAASAAAAAGSASAAATSATDAATQAGVAAGSAAQAGASQSIAQTAANDAAGSAADADNSADVAVAAANDTAGSVAATEAAVQRAFEWAELLTGPVLPAPPGWPEAVDDGMFSSKWWAIRAREYNSVDTIDLGTAGTDIGNAFDIWDAIPGNDLGPGLTYATWGTPPQTYVLVDRGNPSDPTSWVNITGGPGPAGPGNTLTIGTVTTGAVGQPADATITGASPNQVLNLTLPTGATGPQGVIGPAGPPNALAVGTVTTGAPGSSAVVGITGTSPSQTIDFTIPRGDTGATGAQGIQGIQGPVGPAVNLADPTGLIGLAAVNGVATTAPRSDSLHALSQAIVPTWTGTHTFSVDPQIALTNAASPANARVTLIRHNSSVVGFSVASAIDAAPGAAVENIIQANRTGIAWATLSFGNVTDNPTYNFLGTGLATFGGSVQVNGDHIGLANTDVYFSMTDTDAPTDAKVWWHRYTAGLYTLQTRTDGLAPGSVALAINRSGTAVTQIIVGNPTDNPTFDFLGTGLATFNGQVVVTGVGTHFVAVQSVTSGDAVVKLDTIGVQNWAFGNRRADGALAFSAATDLTNLRLVLTPGGQALVTSGVVSNPALSFLADPDTGIYLAATGVVSLAAGGVSYFSVLDGSAMPVRVNTGQLGVPDGTAAAPAYSFTNDPNTGMYRVGPDYFGATVGGVFGGGWVFTANPQAVFVDGTLGAPAIAFDSDRDTGLYHGAANYFLAIAGGSYCCGFYNQGANAQTIFPDGSVGAPSISFGADLDTGMYRFGTNTAGLVAGATGVMLWNPNSMIMLKPIYAVDGTAAAPAYAFDNDTDTGIYRPFVDGIAIAAGGAAGAYVLSSGLYAGPAGSASAPSISFINDSDTGLYNVTANAIGFACGGALHAVIKVGGEPLKLIAQGDPGQCFIGYYRVNTTTRKCYLGYGDSNTDNFYVMNEELGGGLLLGTSGVARLTINGTTGNADFTNAVSGTSFTSTSSRAIKRETGKPSRAADILSRLRPVLYRLLAGDPREQLGLIAEEVHELCPQLSDGKSVSYDRLALLLLADWQESRGIAA